MSLRKIETVVTTILSWLMVSSAQAQSTGVGASAPAYLNVVPFVVMGIVFYFFLIRPQVKRQKLQQSFLSNLKRGDAVITAGGMLGTVEGITEQFVTLEIAPSVRVKMLKNQISSTVSSEVKP